jgi:hypothetical protein
MMPWFVSSSVGTLALVLLSACSSAPPVPDWQKLSTQAVDQATTATLQGQDKLAEHQWAAALAQARRTALPEPMVRVELIRCAVWQASTLKVQCPGFDALSAFAPEPDRAYARYLSGQFSAADVPLLPPAHRAVALALLQPTDAASITRALQSMPDSLSRLVAASVVIHQTPSLPVVAVAVDTASAQGWQRPLLSWLTLQQRLAQELGHTDVAAHAKQRLQWLTEAAAKRPQPN